MLIYMQHEFHGKHIVYSEAEAIENEKVGWVRFDPEKERRGKPVVEQEPEETVKRGPGRPRKEY